MLLNLNGFYFGGQQPNVSARITILIMFVWLPTAVILINPEVAEKDLFQRLHVNPVPSGELLVGVF